MTVLRFQRTTIEIAVQGPALRRVLEESLRTALDGFVPPPEYPTVRLRTFRRLETVDVSGRVVVVRVTIAGLRRLPALVEAIRGKAALGVQLVWDGATPPRALVEPTLFRILETARATRSAPPVVLAATPTPVLALRTSIAARSQA